MKYIFLIITLLFSAQLADAQNQEKQTSLAPEASAQEKAAYLSADLRFIKVKADEVSRFMLAGEYEKMFELMHPKVREITGGKEAFIKLVGDGVKGLKADGFKIISIENFAPETILMIQGQEFAIVPTKIRIQTPQGVLVQSAYDLAVRDSSKQPWLFVGGSNGKEKLGKLFPVIVGKLTFPETTLPVPEK